MEANTENKLMRTSVTDDLFTHKPISPLIEMGAYEHLWLQPKATFKRIAELFKDNPERLPSELIANEGEARELSEKLLKLIKTDDAVNFGIRVFGSIDYPEKLRDAVYPIELLYYKGNWDLTHTCGVAVVGTRKPSSEGIKRCQKLSKQLVDSGLTVISGLAEGIDTIAHTTAIEAGGNTISVIGTPITDYYPAKNRTLQDRIAKDHLLISQIPILKYQSQDWRFNRVFFPERNKTMSALADATVIVEAGETSGTLIQARAAFTQGRKLFILESCFQNPSITWPAKFEKKGAIRVKEISDITDALLDNDNM